MKNTHKLLIVLYILMMVTFIALLAVRPRRWVITADEREYRCHKVYLTVDGLKLSGCLDGDHLLEDIEHAEIRRIDE